MKYALALLLLAAPSFAYCQNAATSATVPMSEEKTLLEYFAKNHIKAQKTEGGVYYTMTKKGDGATIAKGQTVSIMYTGKFLDGRTFDSNVGRNPLQVNAGARQVVAGMDEPLSIMRKGTKCTIYILSPLGYGAQQRGPIPANSTMVFDMEITDVK